MRLPSKLDIGYRPVTVVRKGGDKDAAGHFRDSKREIFLSPSVPDHEQGLAFLHELIHLFLAERDIDLKESVEEQVCDAVSRGLAELMTRNHGVLWAIQQSLEAE